jgi:hypothetical protein
MALSILITNFDQRTPTGTALYTRDLALELMRRGHRPAVYTWLPGAIGDELQAAGIPVFDDLRRCPFRPQVIHGHHNPLLRAALLRYPNTPAVFICHDHTSPLDMALLMPQVGRYFGVSSACVERLLRDGAPAARTSPIYNFVDMRRFTLRATLPARPKTALVFSNYANEKTHLPVVREACSRLGLPLDAVGSGVGRVAQRPEDLLGRYDLVFAKGKAALEAMAVGTAVVLCDSHGVGPMVTPAQFEELRRLNFGYATLREPLLADNLLHQIARYDPTEAALVRDLVRSKASLEGAVQELLAVYDEVRGEWESRRLPAPQRSVPQRLGEARFHFAAALMARHYRTFGAVRPRLWGPVRPLYFAARYVMRRLVGLR